MTIRVVDAAKVIENTQRDVFIAPIHELSIIFSHLDIDTNAVPHASATTWDFNRWSPGLVGGHVAGADPAAVAASYDIAMQPEMPDVAHACDAAILAMAHNALIALGPETLRAPLTPSGVLFDMKAAFDPDDSDLRRSPRLSRQHLPQMSRLDPQPRPGRASGQAGGGAGRYTQPVTRA